MAFPTGATEQPVFHVKTTFSILCLTAASAVAANTSTNCPAWPSRPLSLGDALNIALQQNAAVLKAQRDLEASAGVVVQTRAVAWPKAQIVGQYHVIDENSIDTPSGFPIVFGTDQAWGAEIRVVQSIYAGGRINSALRSAKQTQEQAVALYQTVVADTLLAVRLAYCDVLLAAQQITVQEASVNLLTKEQEDQQRRFDAGTVPRFNVLRAEVELANARPRLIRARNAHRVSKNNLANVLGYKLPQEMREDIPLPLAGNLEVEPLHIELPVAVAQALERRTELTALRKAEELRKEGIENAAAGSRPSLQLFAGYGARSSQFENDLTAERHGWLAGVQASWNLFDGMLTRGKVAEARALHEKSRVEIDDASRRIELEVRTAYSTFIEAKEVLQSQEKVQEQAAEALRLARARSEAGTGTQLDVLSAQTALTQARTTQLQARHDYAVAKARLERAIGQEVVRDTK